MSTVVPRHRVVASDNVASAWADNARRRRVVSRLSSVRPGGAVGGPVGLGG